MTELADKIEAAEGPSRELDAEIDRFNTAYEAGEVVEECDLCGGEGVNRCSQSWPDYPPPCRACAGTGRLSAHHRSHPND